MLLHRIRMLFVLCGGRFAAMMLHLTWGLC